MLPLPAIAVQPLKFYYNLLCEMFVAPCSRHCVSHPFQKPIEKFVLSHSQCKIKVHIDPEHAILDCTLALIRDLGWNAEIIG